MLTLSKTASSTIPNELAEQIDFDERVLWHDIPEQGFRFYPLQGIITAGAAILTLCFSIEIGALWLHQEDVRDWVPFGFLVLVVANAWLVHPTLDVIRRARTQYVLTNRRVLISSGILWRPVQSIEIESLPNLEFHAKSGGRGSVMLGQAYRALTSHGVSSVINPPALDGIANAQHVYDMIQNIRQGK